MPYTRTVHGTQLVYKVLCSHRRGIEINHGGSRPTGYFAHCGERPEALPYMKNFVFHVGLRELLKKLGKNFYFTFGARIRQFSSRRSLCFLSVPPAYPVRLPSEPMTLWHGMMIATGL